MNTGQNDKQLWELVQRQLIHETLMDYCLFVDRNDPGSLVERVFCADGCFELGARHAVIGRDNLARMFAKTLAAFTATSHHLSNVHIHMTGDTTAESTAYVYAWHLTVEDGRRIDLWGRYHDQLRLTAQGWRIANRRLSATGSDGWKNPPFDPVERQPNPEHTPAPEITRR
ncbi:MAG: nuclear transport factor 2 family protein [Gammaproteobacteria bacterium]|nr:nuclear transport factor 2 family protein [Gammaproteobacteria bacterium]